VFTSTLLSKLMDRYPVIVYIGAGILGRVGGEMMMTDAWVIETLNPAPAWRYLVEGLCAALVVLIGWLRRYRLSRSCRP
jgi:predicted tellurium resistance membrane protein TerC